MFMKDTLQSFAVREIRKLMIDKGISQIQLSDDLLISRQMISNYLTGKTEFTLNMFEQFCAAINEPASIILEKYAADFSEIYSAEPEQPYQTDYKRTIIKMKRQIQELKRDKIYLMKAVDVLHKENEQFRDTIDKLNFEISELNK
jgi:transcriptional regulator with XRE-family HTH domain